MSNELKKVESMLVVVDVLVSEERLKRLNCFCNWKYERYDIHKYGLPNTDGTFLVSDIEIKLFSKFLDITSSVVSLYDGIMSK